MKKLLLLLSLALSCATSFAQVPPVSATTHWQVYDGNNTWVPSALDFKNYCLSGLAGLAPTGGTDGQVLTKQSSTNYDYAWETPSGGGGGDFLGTGFTSGGGIGSLPDETIAKGGNDFLGGSITAGLVNFNQDSVLPVFQVPFFGLLSNHAQTETKCALGFGEDGGEMFFNLEVINPDWSCVTPFLTRGVYHEIIDMNTSVNHRFEALGDTGLKWTKDGQDIFSADDNTVTVKRPFVPNKLTSSAKEALTPSDGWMVYDTDLDGTCIYDGTKWLRISQKSTPSVAVGAGAGTGASATVTGNDIEGIVTLTTGTTPTTSAVLFTVTWNDSYSTAPIAVMMTGNSNNAANLPGGRIPYVSSVGTTTFAASNPSINGLADATVYVFNYRTIQ